MNYGSGFMKIRDLINVEINIEKFKEMWEAYKKRNPSFAVWAEQCVQDYLSTWCPICKHNPCLKGKHVDAK